MKRFEDTQLELIHFSDEDVIATSTAFDGDWDDFGGKNKKNDQSDTTDGYVA